MAGAIVMMRLEGAERLILQAILSIQGDSADFTADSRTAKETDLDIEDVRNWLFTLADKDFVNVVRGQNGLRAFIEAKGILALKQSLPFTLKRIEDEQKEQRHEMEMIRFIISHLMSRYEVVHLERLAGDSPFPFKKRASFAQELCRLRDVGFIENHPGGPGISQLPHEGDDLRRFFRVTEPGRQYLRFIGEARSVRTEASGG
jgi:hypothetical protein